MSRESLFVKGNSPQDRGIAPWPRHRIPRTLLQTTSIGMAQIPHAWLHGNFTRGLKWEMFSDDDLERYLALEERVKRASMHLPMGAHKADLWRYFRLWREGGVYADIKTRFTNELHDWLFATQPPSQLPTMYAVRGDRRAR